MTFPTLTNGINLFGITRWPTLSWTGSCTIHIESNKGGFNAGITVGSWLMVNTYGRDKRIYTVHSASLPAGHRRYRANDQKNHREWFSRTLQGETQGRVEQIAFCNFVNLYFGSISRSFSFMFFRSHFLRRAKKHEGKWSGREDLNLRPPQPHCGALPGCATPRIFQMI